MSPAEKSPSGWVRPEVRALAPYHLDLTPCDHKLDQNEMPYEPPRRVKERVVEALLRHPWARYPDFHADALRRRLGEYFGWPAEGVLVGNGSNELLATAIETLVGPGEEILTVAPSFGLYRLFATRVGARLNALPCDAELRLPLEALLAEAGRQPRRPVLLCAPNNPTGEALDPAFVDELAGVLDAPLLLDNAYVEFSQVDYRPLLDQHRNLLLFRTFSKAWSLGRVRLGYLLGDPELVAAIRKVKLPYNVGVFPQLAGLAALDAEEAGHAMRRRVGLLRARRDQLAVLLGRHGLRVYPSDANFLLARTPPGVDAFALWQALERRGIRVRDFTKTPGLENHLRFSAGAGRDLRSLAAALPAALSELLTEASP